MPPPTHTNNNNAVLYLSSSSPFPSCIATYLGYACITDARLLHLLMRLGLPLHSIVPREPILDLHLLVQRGGARALVGVDDLGLEQRDLLVTDGLGGEEGGGGGVRGRAGQPGRAFNNNCKNL